MAVEEENMQNAERETIEELTSQRKETKDMALNGPGKLLTSPHGNPAGKTLKNSPYGKLPDKSKKKPKKNEPNDKDSKNTETTANSGVALKEIFTLLADENGRITSAKLRGFVKELDLDFSEEEIKEMIEVVDPSGKGEISYSNLVGIVRDFSHEFPNVQLNPEDLNRELTSESLPSNKEENKSAEANSDEQNSDKISADKEKETTQGEQVSKPLSSKARIAETAKRIIDELDDKMSVIKEDDEPEQNDEETEVEDKTENVSEKENDLETDNDGERSEETLKANDNDKEIVISEDNDSSISTAVAVKVPSLDKDDDSAAEDEDTNKLYTEESEDEDERMLKSQSRASIVKEHRLDSGISTAVGRMKEVVKDTEIGRRSRKSSTSDTSQKSRRDSLKSHNRERSNSRSKRLDKRRKSIPRKKFHSVNDPEFYSTMGCSLKLSQIRTRQRLLYVMWRAVYDQAIRKMQEEQVKQKNQKKKKLKTVKQDPSLKAV